MPRGAPAAQPLSDPQPESVGLTTQLQHSHTEEAIRRRLIEGPSLNYLRDWVYGGIDGAVTTFAIVAGVVGAELSATIVLILGVANLVADGFSMAASNYSGTKAERDEYNQLRHHETHQIDRDPEGEREEIRQIFRLKGFRGTDLDRAVDIITADRQRWIDTMMSEEYGMAAAPRDPLKSGASTFIAFVLCGAVPLLPFVFQAHLPFHFSIALTAFVFFLIGSIKSRWSLAPWWRSGLETLTIGLGAALIAYAVGYALKDLGS
jgi:VIT1/CCC1 family predicted Fe2+/Mn2+ transporter